MTRINLQDISKPDQSDPDNLKVHSIFKTIQGEGPFAGKPSIFIRLSGCNLQCPFCDTDYTTQNIPLSVESIIDRVNLIRGKIPLVVLTGGEPFRQNISKLCREFAYKGIHVQVETNGTLFVKDMPTASPFFTIVCSPKTPSLHPDIIAHANFYKYILQHGNTSKHDGLPTKTMGTNVPICRPPNLKSHMVYVQPLDEGDEMKNQENANACIQSCYDFGYTLSVQVHKIIGVE